MDVILCDSVTHTQITLKLFFLFFWAKDEIVFKCNKYIVQFCIPLQNANPRIPNAV